MNKNAENIIYNYDEEGDILYISFRPGAEGMGINLTEHILLRFNPQTKEPIGLTLLDFSVLVSPTDMGPRNFPLTELDKLPAELRQTVMEIITSAPVNRVLKVAAFYATPAQYIPITRVERTSAIPVPA